MSIELSGKAERMMAWLEQAKSGSLAVAGEEEHAIVDELVAAGLVKLQREPGQRDPSFSGVIRKVAK